MTNSQREARDLGLPTTRERILPTTQVSRKRIFPQQARRRELSPANTRIALVSLKAEDPAKLHARTVVSC